MAKKKKNFDSNQRAMSFAESVSAEQIRRINEYVQAQIGAYHSHIQKTLNYSIAAMINRLTVMESIITDKLNLPANYVDLKVAEYEDSVTDFVAVEQAEEGDLVRFSAKLKGSEDKPTRSRIFDLNKNIKNERKEIHEALLGKKAGDCLEVSIDDKVLEVVVERVSREVKKEETTNG